MEQKAGTWIVGIDEAGRGPLAGPVAVGFAMIPMGTDLAQLLPGLNDSKKIGEKKREEIYERVRAGVACADIVTHVVFKQAREIDERGIAVVIREAITEGLEHLMKSSRSSPSEVRIVLDGALCAPSQYSQETIIGGDAIESTIMLASVMAKVERDRHMVMISHEFPLYDFAKHKGYGTKNHRDALVLYGLSTEHRKSFCRNICAVEDL